MGMDPKMCLRKSIGLVNRAGSIYFRALSEKFKKDLLFKIKY
jgi:hypothetical protein